MTSPGAVAGAVAIAVAALVPGTAGAQSFEAVGRSDLGGGGLNGPVAIVGTAAIVGAGVAPGAGIHTHFYNPYPCPAVAVKVVDLADPANPIVAATIPVPEGVAAIDVDALRVETPSFRGDLAAIALARCGPAGNGVERGVVYYDVTNPASPLFLGRYQADADNARPGAPPCGSPPEGSDERCAASQHSVELVRLADGRVLSLSTEPGASASRLASGDLRIVDVSDPRAPVQIASWPGPGQPIESVNGCRPFAAAHDAAAARDGTLALVALFDGGLAVLDLADPAAPREIGRWRYPEARELEGNAAYVAAGEVGGRLVAIVSEEDWIAPTTRVRIDEPRTVAGARFACEAMFTLFDPEGDAQLYRRPGRAVAAEFAYVGRGCPARPAAGGGGAAGPEDRYLADPARRIALVDRTRQPTQPRLAAGPGCSIADRVRRAQAAGAVAVVVFQTDSAAPRAFAADGDPAGLRIPAAMIDRPTGDYLRSLLCPSIDRLGSCRDGVAVKGALVDEPGEWGGLRLFDLSDPATPRVVGVARTPHADSLPSGPEVYAPHHGVIDAGWFFIAAGADGLVAFELGPARPDRPVSFVPPASGDPTGVLPAATHVVGVAIYEPPGGAARYVVVTDLHSGLYVLGAGGGP